MKRHLTPARRTALGPAPVTSRTGLTLFEVVLALGIFLGALAALGQLTSTGSRAAIQSRLETQCILRADTKLSEVLAGVEPLQAAAGTFEDDDRYGWDLAILAGPLAETLQLEVTVTFTGTNPPTTATYTLRRLVRDPQLFIDAELMAAEEAALAAEAESGLE